LPNFGVNSGCTQVEPPRDRLSHGGSLLMGLGASMWVLHPDVIGWWAFSFICLFCAFLIAHFNSTPMYFLYVSRKTMILQYMWN
jgi:hypothetical protein